MSKALQGILAALGLDTDNVTVVDVSASQEDQDLDMGGENGQPINVDAARVVMFGQMTEFTEWMLNSFKGGYEIVKQQGDNKGYEELVKFHREIVRSCVANAIVTHLLLKGGVTGKSNKMLEVTGEAFGGQDDETQAAGMSKMVDIIVAKLNELFPIEQFATETPTPTEGLQPIETDDLIPTVDISPIETGEEIIFTDEDDDDVGLVAEGNDDDMN